MYTLTSSTGARYTVRLFYVAGVTKQFKNVAASNRIFPMFNLYCNVLAAFISILDWSRNTSFSAYGPVSCWSVYVPAWSLAMYRPRIMPKWDQKRYIVKIHLVYVQIIAMIVFERYIKIASSDDVDFWPQFFCITLAGYLLWSLSWVSIVYYCISLIQKNLPYCCYLQSFTICNILGLSLLNIKCTESSIIYGCHSTKFSSRKN